jgi:hypothetical protein
MPLSIGKTLNRHIGFHPLIELCLAVRLSPEVPVKDLSGKRRWEWHRCELAIHGCLHLLGKQFIAFLQHRSLARKQPSAIQQRGKERGHWSLTPAFGHMLPLQLVCNRQVMQYQITVAP